MTVMVEPLGAKYRPTTFEEVVGQESIVSVLKNQLDTNNLKNVYLFVGPAGTGKTTLARILAKNLDDAFIVEIDAASYNSVTDARELVQQAKTQPITGKYRCYIIDEVHSLSTQAFQVLLKIFEEPPAKTIFILCTTDPHIYFKWSK
jgi:DNA polymerase-3 subunit gamma/tau